MRHVGLLVARIVFGGYLFVHGAQKLFGWFEGPGLEKTGAGFEARGMRPGKVMAAVAGASASPPEGVHPDAGAAPLPIPPEGSPDQVALGDRIFHGQVGGAACTGCHGDSGEGTPLAPPLTGKSKKWLWSDGSYAGIAKTITEGVPQPKEYRSPMPPMGAAQLTPDQLSALAAYLWSFSHK